MAPLKNYFDLFDHFQTFYLFRREFIFLMEENIQFFFYDAISSFSGGHLKASCRIPLLSKGQSFLFGLHHRHFWCNF